jgi:DNA-binding GntR family transcriptional regulator
LGVDFQTTTVAEKLYERMRSDIIFGRLAPGRRLRLDRLAQEYGASVSTLREVLNRLASERLVVAEGQRGFGVAPVSIADFEEIAALRLLLEEYAIALSFAAGDVEWEGNVAAAHHKLAAMERRMLAGERDMAERWKGYDREFHQALIGACGSQTLVEIYAGVYDRYLRYQMVAVVFRGAVAADEHHALLDCALKRDADAARAILRAHIEGCVAHTRDTGLIADAPHEPAGDPETDAEMATVGETAYRRLRADILSGHLAPDLKLRLDTLKADYGISVSTLREILNRLASERLVIAEGQKGFRVSPVSVESLREIAELRQMLECHALEQSFAAGDIEWEGRVVAAHHKLARLEARMAAGDEGATAEWKRYDWQFHQSLISACGSKALIDTHAAVFDRYLRYQMTSLSYRGDIASGEHQRMLDSALKRDWKTACDTLRRHVQGGMAHALATGTIR